MVTDSESEAEEQVTGYVGETPAQAQVQAVAAVTTQVDQWGNPIVNIRPMAPWETNTGTPPAQATGGWGDTQTGDQATGQEQTNPVQTGWDAPVQDSSAQNVSNNWNTGDQGGNAAW